MPDGPGLPYWLGLVRRRLVPLVAAGLLAGALGYGIASTLPFWYRASASVLPPREASPGVGLSGIAAALQLDPLLPFEGRVTRLDVYLGILASDRLAWTLIDRFDLQEHYDQSTRTRTLAALRRNTRVIPTPEFIVRVEVEDKDPRLAADLANAFVEELDRVYRETRSTAAARQLEFLDRRVARSAGRLDSLEAALADLQVREGMTSMGGGTSEATSVASDLLARRVGLAVEIDMLDSFGVRDAPQRARLEGELRAVDAEIGVLPGVGLGLGRLIREIRLEEALLEALRDQRETARIEVIRETPAVEILDRAAVPDRRVRPKRGLITLVAAVLAGWFLLSVFAYREGAWVSSSSR